MKKILVVCTTDSMIWNFLVPHIKTWESNGYYIDCASSKTGFYFDELIEKYNFNMKEIPFERNPFKINNFKCFFKLNKIVKQGDYDLIICQEPVGGAMGRLVSIGKKVKIIYTAHGFHFFRGAPIVNWLLFYPFERFLANFTDVLITSNEEDFIRGKKFKADKLLKIDGVGIDLDKFSNIDVDIESKKTQLGIPVDAEVIFNAAELIARKNHIVSIKAFAKMNRPNCYFVICGVGEQENELKILCRDLGVDRNVLFLGFRKDLPELYKIADVFFFPSLQEGLSVSLLGAMASKLPVVCSNIRGNVDVIDNLKGGYLFEVDDIDGFAKGLESILNNKQNFGNYNYEVVEKYKLENVCHWMLQVVNQASGKVKLENEEEKN